VLPVAAALVCLFTERTFAVEPNPAAWTEDYLERVGPLDIRTVLPNGEEADHNVDLNDTGFIQIKLFLDANDSDAMDALTDADIERDRLTLNDAIVEYFKEWKEKLKKYDEKDTALDEVQVSVSSRPLISAMTFMTMACKVYDPYPFPQVFHDHLEYALGPRNFYATHWTDEYFQNRLKNFRILYYSGPENQSLRGLTSIYYYDSGLRDPKHYPETACHPEGMDFWVSLAEQRVAYNGSKRASINGTYSKGSVTREHLMFPNYTEAKLFALEWLQRDMPTTTIDNPAVYDIGWLRAPSIIREECGDHTTDMVARSEKAGRCGDVSPKKFGSKLNLGRQSIDMAVVQEWNINISTPRMSGSRLWLYVHIPAFVEAINRRMNPNPNGTLKKVLHKDLTPKTQTYGTTVYPHRCTEIDGDFCDGDAFRPQSLMSLGVLVSIALGTITSLLSSSM